MSTFSGKSIEELEALLAFYRKRDDVATVREIERVLKEKR